MTEPRPTDDASAFADDRRQRLVAYLDGEMSDDESLRVESELSVDGALREEVQRLDRVWNALDELPRATVDAGFTRSTVEMAAVEAEQRVEQLTMALPVRRRRRRYGRLAACVAVLLAGVVAARGLARQDDRRLLAELPVVYQFDALGQFRDAAFLRALRANAEGLLAEFDGEETKRRAADWKTIADASPPERAAWIGALPDAEKRRLEKAAKRHADDTERSRDRLRELQRTLHREPDAERLYATAIAYQAWLVTQPPVERSRLRQIDDPAERAAEADRRFQAERNRQAKLLSDADAAALRTAIKGLAGDPRLRELRETIGRRVRSEPAPLGERTGQPLFRRWVRHQQRNFETRLKKYPALPIVVMAELASEKPNGLTRFLPWALRDDFPPLVETAKRDWPAIEERLVAALSREARGRLEQFPNDATRIDRLRAWVIEASREAREPDPAELEGFFASDAVTQDQRRRLLALPREKMRSELKRLYVEHEFGAPAADAERPRRGPRGRPNGADYPPPRRSSQPQRTAP